MNPRTLVITLGQLRAHQLTWATFKENVLDQLQADLAVCVSDDAFLDFTNPFYVNARFRWLVPDAPDFSGIYDRIQHRLGSTEDWRTLCTVPGHWFGGIAQSNHRSKSAVLYMLKWFMLDHIRGGGLTAVYDRFVITRPDFYYFSPHPPLECLVSDRLWVPDGEDYGGLCDRHLVVSADNLVGSCNLIDDLLLCPAQMREAMIERDNYWSSEKLFLFHLTRNDLITKVKRFPYVMCLVRAPEDSSSWSAGALAPEVGMVVKYPSELHEAKRYRNFLRSNEDWRLYFASVYFADLLPARIYTTHGTVLYVDEATGQLRHGPLSDCPDNVLFIPKGEGGTIIHRSGHSSRGIVCFFDHSESVSLDTPGSPSGTPADFSRVNVSRGTALDQTLMANNLVGLRSGDLYLSAEPNGQITLHRSHCHMWEHFRIIPDIKYSLRGLGATSCG